jgi:carbonic anhydrase/acetyltransferase-like protein (isoleucine patch superfamily)
MNFLTFKKAILFLFTNESKIIIRVIVEKLTVIFIHTCQFPRVVFYKILSNNKNVTVNNLTMHQPILLCGKGEITLDSCHLGCWPSPYFWSTYAHIEARYVGSSVSIGKNTFVNNNAVFIADKTSISIGENVLIGPNFFVTDSDFHGLQPKNRTNGQYKCHPVIICDGVFVGANVTILKGVTVGVNSIISAGSVVYNNVPDNVIFGGVPAKLIKKL